MEIRLLRIAEDPVAHAQGLQYVKHLAPKTGMLFKFERPQVLSFWMINTYIPLDIAFINQEGIIVKKASMTPLSLSSISSGKPCVLALEVPAGTLHDDVLGKKIDIDAKTMKVTIHG